MSTGATPDGNCAATMPSESALDVTNSALPPTALNSLEIVFWNGVAPSRAAGSQTRVTPEGFTTSIRVVISKVRQPCVSVLSANICFASEQASAAETMPAERRNSRRFMYSPLPIYAATSCDPVLHSFSIRPSYSGENVCQVGVIAKFHRAQIEQHASFLNARYDRNSKLAQTTRQFPSMYVFA